MRYYCECFKDCPEEAGFDAWCIATVSIKVDKYGCEITDQIPDWDYNVDTNCAEILEGAGVTCGCCGEEAKILE